MPNAENLKSFKDRTEIEQRKIQSKGGKASGEARRRKKAIRECLEELLKTNVSVDKDGNPIDGNTAMAITAFKAAINGDWKAWELVRDTSGQKPVDKVMIAEIDKGVIDEVESIIDEIK